MTTATATACVAATPVRVTVRLPRFRNRRKVEAWAAESIELDTGGKPLWSYRRLEMTGTPWEVRHSAHRHGFGWYGSLDAAAHATANGSALAAIERMEAEIAQTAARLTRGSTMISPETFREIERVRNEWPDGIHTCAELQRLEPGRRPCTCGRCPGFSDRPKVCPGCGCDPAKPWYCGCENEDCPCYEEEEED